MKRRVRTWSGQGPPRRPGARAAGLDRGIGSAGAEHNLIQQPSLIARLSKYLGLRQAHVAPVMNEGLQAVVIAGDVREARENSIPRGIVATCTTSAPGINRAIAFALINPSPTGKGGTGPQTTTPRTLVIETVRVAINNPAAPPYNSRFGLGVAQLRDWTALFGGGGVSTEAATHFQDIEALMTQYDISVAAQCLAPQPECVWNVWQGAASFGVAPIGGTPGLAQWLEYFYVVDPSTGSQDSSYKSFPNRVTVPAGFAFFIWQIDAFGAAGGVVGVTVECHEEDPSDSINRLTAQLK